jgi:hypothetical protein
MASYFSSALAVLVLAPALLAAPQNVEYCASPRVCAGTILDINEYANTKCFAVDRHKTLEYARVPQGVRCDVNQHIPSCRNALGSPTADFPADAKPWGSWDAGFHSLIGVYTLRCSFV